MNSFSNNTHSFVVYWFTFVNLYTNFPSKGTQKLKISTNVSKSELNSLQVKCTIPEAPTHDFLLVMHN